MASPTTPLLKPAPPIDERDRRFRAEIDLRRREFRGDPRRLDRLGAGVLAAVAVALATALAIAIFPELKAAPPAQSPAEAALAVQGASVYSAACAACHGADLKGQLAPVAGQTAAPPLDGSGHAWLHSDADLLRRIKYGVGDCGADQNAAPEMPGFAETVGDEPLRAVIAFIKHSWPPELRQVQAAVDETARDRRSEQESAAICLPVCRPAASVSVAASTRTAAKPVP